MQKQQAFEMAGGFNPAASQLQTIGHKGLDHDCVLIERGVGIVGMKVDRKVEILSSHPDLLAELSAVQQI